MEHSKRSIIFQSLTIAGAYTAYNVGSGFATGTEVLQFFASWNGIFVFIAFAIALIFTVIN